MDMSLDDIDPEVDMESSMDGSRKANSLINVDDDDEKLKCYSFWCLIGLGNVVVPASSSLL
jgi:dynactin-4